MNKLFKINDNDNVAIALESLAKGEKVDGITLLDDIPFGHKVLLKDMNLSATLRVTAKWVSIYTSII